MSGGRRKTILHRLAAGLQAVIMAVFGIMLVIPPPGAVKHTDVGGEQGTSVSDHHSTIIASAHSHHLPPAASAEGDAHPAVPHEMRCQRPTPGCCCDGCRAFVAAHFITLPAANVTLFSPMLEEAPPIPSLITYRRLLDPPPVPPPVSA